MPTEAQDLWGTAGSHPQFFLQAEKAQHLERWCPKDIARNPTDSCENK